MNAPAVIADPVERARSALHSLDSGCGREEWVRVAMAGKAAGLSLDDFTEWSSGANNFAGEADCRAVWRSINGDGGIGPGTLFAMARDAGWHAESGANSPRPAPSAPTPRPTKKTAPAPDPAAVWAPLDDATDDHGYIVAKRGMATGLRTVPDGDPLQIAGQSVAAWLAVPVRSLDGTLRTIQFIPPPGTGRKLNLPGCSFADGMHIVGDLEQSARAFIVEGIGQAWACWQATGCAAVVCFGAGRMSGVAKLVRKKYPGLSIVIAPDRGKEQQAAAIAAEIGGTWVEMPADAPANYDCNDYAADHGTDELADLLATAKSPPIDRTSPLPWELPEPIGPAEWMQARPAPDCIVAYLLFADVAVLNAPGGTGKTTLVLYLAICIVLARVFLGLPIERSGPVLIVTAEDTREMLVARLRMIAEAMGLTESEIAIVRRDVVISDLSGSGFRLTAVVGDTVQPDDAVDVVAREAAALKPTLVVFDPAISFGVGEARVNDAEQGLVEAARRLRRALNCGVLYIHHSGKQNARDGATDQYAGRGGSAFADGARMVLVLQPLSADAWAKATGATLQDGETGLILARPKLSYCAPQPPIYVRRSGYTFSAVLACASPQRDRLADVTQLVRLVASEIDKGQRHSARSLEALHTEAAMTRQQMRDALAGAFAAGRLVEQDLPVELRQGRKRTFIAPKLDGAIDMPGS